MKNSPTVNKFKVVVPYKVWLAASMAMASCDVRYYLNGIHLKGQRVESTNGHVAYTAKILEHEVIDCSQPFFPKDGVIIQPKNKIPKSTKAKDIHHVLIERGEFKQSEVSIKYLSLYKETLSTDIGIVVDGRFPNQAKLMADAKKRPIVNAPTGINTGYLSLPDKMLAGEKFPIITMKPTGATSSILFTLNRDYSIGAKEWLLVMPARV